MQLSFHPNCPPRLLNLLGVCAALLAKILPSVLLQDLFAICSLTRSLRQALVIQYRLTRDVSVHSTVSSSPQADPLYSTCRPVRTPLLLHLLTQLTFPTIQAKLSNQSSLDYLQTFMPLESISKSILLGLTPNLLGINPPLKTSKHEGLGPSICF